MTRSAPKLRAAASASASASSGSAAAERFDVRGLSRAERSAYFARREAAKVLQRALEGDARGRAVASIKTLVYKPSVRNKKGTLALVCETLKRLSIIKDVLESSNALSAKWKGQKELMYIITHDILFGQDIPLVGAPENFLMLKKDMLQSSLARLLVSKGVKRVEDLMDLQNFPDVSRPCYVRVNTLILDVDSALLLLGKNYMVQKDDLVPDLLVLPPGTDLHRRHLVQNGSVFIQSKGSSMVAIALEPKPGWEVIDGCAAPGNKTIHLAALMGGKGKIIACDLHKERIKRLNETIKLSKASNVKTLNQDFLKLDPKDPSYSKVRAILLDPSCSGSGTTAGRLDHLLPSYAESAEMPDINRLNKLATFQRKALTHALCFPAVERVVYSTCSIHQIENEDVIKSVLPVAAKHGFRLVKPFPRWPRRGLPVVEGSECLLRMDPSEDKEGFFIALFVREPIPKPPEKRNQRPQSQIRKQRKKLTLSNSSEAVEQQEKRTLEQLQMPILKQPKKRVYKQMYNTPFPSTKLSKCLLGYGLSLQKTRRKKCIFLGT